MQYCHQCNTKLEQGAKFCHICGSPRRKKCNHCHAECPMEAQFCPSCGNAIVPYKYEIDWTKIHILPQQLKKYFQNYLLEQIEIDGNIAQQAAYLEALEEESFRIDILEPKLLELSEILEDKQNNPNPDKKIESHFWIIYLYLITKYAKKINNFILSERILQYFPKNKPQEINWHAMMLDYLDLSKEKYVYYTSLIQIPVSKLNNARKSFFGNDIKEIPFVFIDFTIFGTGKEGLILTQNAVYWKNAFHVAAKVEFKNIESLKYFKNHLEINKIYLSINASCNYKLFKLLQNVLHLIKM